MGGPPLSGLLDGSAKAKQASLPSVEFEERIPEGEGSHRTPARNLPISQYLFSLAVVLPTPSHLGVRVWRNVPGMAEQPRERDFGALEDIPRKLPTDLG